MYKKILLVATIVAGLSSCSGDYTDWVMPKENTAQTTKTAVLVATPVKDVIDLEYVEEDSVKVVTFDSMPTVSSFAATYNFVNGDNKSSIEVDEQGRVSTDDLKNAIANLYGRNRVVRTLSGKITAYATTKQTEVQDPIILNLATSYDISIQAEYPDQPSYYFYTGNPNGWTDQAQTPFAPTLEDKNIQTITTYFTGSWDGKIWFKEDLGDWSKCYGTEQDGDNSPSGTLINSNAQSFSAPTAGFYTLTVNWTTKTYTWTICDDQFPAEYTAIGLIGLNGDWDNDVDMTQAKESHIWYAYNVVATTDNAAKFRANHDWGTNWGNGSDFPYGTGVQNGDNISIPAGTYDVYFNDITGQYVFMSK